MSIIRGGKSPFPPLATAGKPLIRGGGNIAAPPVVVAPSELIFNMASARPGVPAVNDQFENYGRERDWVNNFSHPSEGFAGIRWQPTWKRADDFAGSWEPAEGEVFRVHRKGATGADLRTLIFTCSPNPAAIPAGEPIVLWTAASNGGVNRTETALTISGFNLPMRSKLIVSASTGSTLYDTAGRRMVEVLFTEDLPAIDYTVPTFSDGGTWRTMRMRHWRFYKNTALKTLRHPLEWFRGVTINNVLANGGYSMLGGCHHRPTWYDWTRDHWNFGATLTEELWRLECEGLAEHFGATDPRKLAVELENEPTSPWGATSGLPGYGDLLPDVWYGIARTAWGQERTLVVKPTSYASLDSLRTEFNFRCPAGHNAHLATHNYDGQAHMANNNNYTMTFAKISETDYYAQTLSDKIQELGYKGGGMTEMGAYPFEWYDFAIKNSQTVRGQRMGRMLTSLTNKGLYVFYWGMLNTDPNTTLDMASMYQLDGNNIQAMRTEMRPYASRAGLITT